ncbi:MAG: ribosomal protein L13e [Candidatus Bathyarchaeota archaeon]|nr:MAG: ribosomal protein L13e [Candidatus Bathyarchaeota archaeon]
MASSNCRVGAHAHKRDGRSREGRGFSREELKKAGLSVKQALCIGLAIDTRRRTIHDDNVERLAQEFKRRGTSKNMSPRQRISLRERV